MYARVALELVKEMSLTTELTPYNSTAVTHVLSEMEALLAERTRLLDSEEYEEDKDTLAPAALYYHLGVQRNTRCLLAYLNERLQRIQRLRYETGSLVPSHVKELLSPTEHDFFTAYNDNLDEYMEAAGDLDLTSDLVPPRELYIEVRAEQDSGEVQTEFGPLRLRKNAQYLLRRSDVEHLIRQGILTPLSE